MCDNKDVNLEDAEEIKSEDEILTNPLEECKTPLEEANSENLKLADEVVK